MEQIKNISILGAGNIGIAIAVDLSQKKDLKISLLTSKATTLQLPLQKIDIETSEVIVSRNVIITSDYSVALTDCDLLIITVPTFLIKDTVEKVSEYNPKVILFEPGYGGKEFFCKKLIEKGCIIAGLERVTHISRLYEPNKVRASKKKELNLACLNSHHTENLCNELENLFDIKCNSVKNYLTVTLPPSNPILHTARLYSLFKTIDFNTPILNQIEFYSEWDDASSKQLFLMDSELQSICNAISGIDLSGVKSLPVHYESKDEKALTKKLRSITSFKGIKAPLYLKDNKFFLDSNSRYFKEDFIHGLCILKAFSLIAKIETPHFDEVLRWYENISDEELWTKDGCFNGHSLHNVGLPQNYGINSIDDIVAFYQNSEL